MGTSLTRPRHVPANKPDPSFQNGPLRRDPNASGCAHPAGALDLERASVLMPKVSEVRSEKSSSLCARANRGRLLAATRLSSGDDERAVLDKFLPISGIALQIHANRVEHLPGGRGQSGRVIRYQYFARGAHLNFSHAGLYSLRSQCRVTH